MPFDNPNRLTKAERSAANKAAHAAARAEAERIRVAGKLAAEMARLERIAAWYRERGLLPPVALPAPAPVAIQAPADVPVAHVPDGMAKPAKRARKADAVAPVADLSGLDKIQLRIVNDPAMPPEGRAFHIAWYRALAAKDAALHPVRIVEDRFNPGTFGEIRDSLPPVGDAADVYVRLSGKARGKITASTSGKVMVSLPDELRVPALKFWAGGLPAGAELIVTRIPSDAERAERDSVWEDYLASERERVARAEAKRKAAGKGKAKASAVPPETTAYESAVAELAEAA